MKVIVTETQLRKLAKTHGKIKDVEEAASLTSPSTTNTATSSPSTSTTSSGSESNGTSPGAADYPAYPEVDHADDLVKRGVANPVDYSKKRYEDYPEANPVRGRANPVKGM